MHSKKLLLLSATLGLTWFSCSKSPQSPAKDPASNNPVATNRQNLLAARGGGCADPANPDNPLDSIGIYHNMAMDYVASRGQGQTKSLPGNVDYANQFMMEKLGSRVPDLDSKLFSSTDVKHLLADTSGSFANTIAATPYSKAVKVYFNNLIASIKDTSSAQASDYCFIKANITRLETTALNDNLLSDVEKGEILTITSLARYSLFHWNNAFLATANPQDGASTNRHWWQWAIIGICDVAGGIVGGAAGAAASTPTLGISAPVLVTAGAITGAAGASGGAAAVL